MTSKEFWDDYLQVYDVLTKFQDYNEMLDDLARQAASGKAQRVLDAGSGTGNLSIRMVSMGLDVCSLDFSSTAVEEHKRKDPTANVIQASLEDSLPYPDKHFDVIICASVLFALSDAGREKALHEFKRVLKPGGRLIASVIKGNTSKTDMLLRHVKQRFWAASTIHFLKEMTTMGVGIVKFMRANRRMKNLSKIGAYRRFTLDALKGDISKAGFSSINGGEAFGGAFHLLSAS